MMAKTRSADPIAGPSAHPGAPFGTGPATGPGTPPGDGASDSLGASTDGSSTAPSFEMSPSHRTPRRVPALTILMHPDPQRVGDRVLLGELAGGRAARLARAEPRFEPPRGGRARPLDERVLSRTPIRLRPARPSSPGGGVRLERGDSRTSVSVDGIPLIDRLEIPEARLEAGAVVLLGSRIVLLLHRLQLESALGDGDRRAEPPTHRLVGESDAIRALRRRISRVADVDVPLLLLGPTGSGKELVARALHDRGPAPEGPFVAVNLGALTPSLAASELFGSRKGAFTSAVRDRRGHFARAHGGTLFLDEVGEAPAELQVMLLRALETGEIVPVGGSEPVRPRARVIAATDADLDASVVAGTFRAPLLHRLAGYRLHVPSLAERRDDVGRLFLHFVTAESLRLGGEPPRSSDWIDPIAVARLALYSWPGNVRELRNVARELAIDSRGAGQITLSPRLDALLPVWGAEPGADERPTPRRRRKPSEVPEDELLTTLRAHRFDLKATAEALGVSRTGLYARIDRSPNVRKASDLSEPEIRAATERHGDDLDALVEALEVSERALRQRLKDLGLR